MSGEQAERKRGDVRPLVEQALLGDPGRKQREIAASCACSQSFVAQVKKELLEAGNITMPAERTDSLGRKRPTSYQHKPKQAVEETQAAAASYLPKAGHVAHAFIGKDDGPDFVGHWFMIQEDCRNPGYFYAAHYCGEEDKTTGSVDFTMRPIRADAWKDRRFSPISRWMPAGAVLEWHEIEEAPDWLWINHIEPYLPERMAHLKRKKIEEQGADHGDIAR